MGGSVRHVSFADDEDVIRTPVGHKQIMSVARCSSGVTSPSRHEKFPAQDSQTAQPTSNGSPGTKLCTASPIIRTGSSKSFTVSNYGDIRPEDINVNDGLIDDSLAVPKDEVNLSANPCKFIPNGHPDINASLIAPPGDDYPHETGKDHQLSHDFKGRQNSIMNKRLTKSMHDISIVARQQNQTLCNTLSPGNRSNAQSQRSIMSVVSNYLVEVAKRGRMFAQSRQIDRIIEKNGDLNVSFTNIRKRKRRFIADIFTTLMDLKWRFVIAMFVAAFVFSWLSFAVIWWVIVKWISGEVDVTTGQTTEQCVTGVKGFVEALLFSIETQHTIGYGTRVITSQCPIALITMMIQSVFGVLIQCVMAGLIFAKLSRGKNRAETFIFSKNAVICEQPSQNKQLPKRVLMFRIGDMRKSQLIGARIHVMLLKRRLTAEGVVDLHQVYLKTSTQQDDGFFFLAWPFVVMHVIDESSPMWGVSAESLLQEDMEIIAILEGIVAATGMTTQVRTSYLPSEVLWAHKILPLMSYKSNNSVGSYKIDYGSFHEVEPDKSMSDLSAEQMHANYVNPCTYPRLSRNSSHKSAIRPTHLYLPNQAAGHASAKLTTPSRRHAQDLSKRHSVSSGTPGQVSITITGEDNDGYAEA